MLTKEECEKALMNICSSSAKMEDRKVFYQLINEHFDNSNNSANFNHFKLHADSTLKSLTKNELIDYIHMLHHNWQITDINRERVVKVNFHLQDEINELKSNRKQVEE